jgi:hypothetical protein
LAGSKPPSDVMMSSDDEQADQAILISSELVDHVPNVGDVG